MKTNEIQTSSGVPIGTIVAFVLSKTNIPSGWLLCDGSKFNSEEHSGLNKLLGTNNLPALCGRTLIGSGTVAAPVFNSTSFSLNQVGGEEQHQLSVDEMPKHGHSVNDNYAIESNFHVGSTNVVSSDADWTHSNFIYPDDKPNVDGVKITSNGKNQPHNNMQPYYAVNYIIFAGK